MRHRVNGQLYPSAGHSFSSLPAREVNRRLLEDYGILIRDVSDSAQLSECVRISIGTAEDMDAAIDALKQILLGGGKMPSPG